MSYQQGEKKEKLQVQKSENVSCPPVLHKAIQWARLVSLPSRFWLLGLIFDTRVAAEVQEEIFFSFFSLRMEN